MEKIILCTYCGHQLDEWEVEEPYTDDYGDIMCDECYKENYQDYCGLCEEYYDKPTKPEELFFVVSKEASTEVSMSSISPGIYQTIHWPYFMGATGFGFETLFESSIRLVRELDINSMLSKLYSNYHKEIGANEICPECVEKYTNIKYKKRTGYCNKEYKLHWSIYERGIINEGK